MFIYVVVFRHKLIEVRKQFDLENCKAIFNVTVVGVKPSPPTQTCKKNWAS